MYKKLIWSLLGATCLIALALYLSSMSLPELEEAILHAPQAQRSVDDSIHVESILREGKVHISAHRPVFGLRRIDEQLSAFIDERIALFEDLDDFTIESDPSDLLIEYEVVHRSPNYLSLLFCEKRNTQHTPNANQIFTFNFDIGTQERLELSHFFQSSEPLFHTFYELAQQKILEGSIPDVALNEAVTRVIAPLEYNYHNFTIDSEKITFYIRPGELDFFPLSILFQELAGKIERLPVVGSSIIAERPAAFKLRAPIVANDPGSPRKKVALIFLDGPHYQYTEAILDILYERQARATFAPLGIRAAEFEPLVRRILWEGHRVENHGWSKPPYNRADLASDYRRAKELFDKLSISSKHYIIPGAVLSAAKLRSIPAHVLTQMTCIDEKTYPDPARVIPIILGDIDRHRILCFNESAYTVNVLPKLIDALYDAGYEVDLLDAVR
ncbi:MAG: polysaccharide deacetylase family protein [Bacillota bacterium]|nr:polysaccharide deacetylase family protein [Bacillota bacterium]